MTDKPIILPVKKNVKNAMQLIVKESICSNFHQTVMLEVRGYDLLIMFLFQRVTVHFDKNDVIQNDV